MHRLTWFGLAIVVVLSPTSLSSQTRGIATRLIFPNETGRTGVFRIPRDNTERQVQAEIRSATGALLDPRRCAVTWRSGDERVLRINRSESGSAWVTPGSEGITELSASFACNAESTRTIPVVVGAAAIDRPFAAATDSLDNFYPKSLKVTVPGWARVSGGDVFFRPIDRGIQFVASAYNKLDNLITPHEFPMKWSVSNPAVLKLDTAYDHTVFVTPTGTGTATVTFAVEGLKRSFDVTVQDAHPATSDDHATLRLNEATTLATRSAGIIDATAPITAGAGVIAGTASGTISQPVTTTAGPLTTIDPAAVHATGFTAISGYGNIQLKWNAAPGATGYRIAREAWDPALQRWIETGSKRIPSAIGPDAVSSPADLITETTYLDQSLDPRTQYVYVLSTFYQKSRTGAYYYADRASEPKATATPKDAAAMTWLPADWQAAPRLTKVEIVSQQPGGKSTITYRVEWQPKGGAAGYLVSIIESGVAFERDTKTCGSRPYPLQVAPTRPGTWYLTLGNAVQHTSQIEISQANIKIGILDADPGVCVQVRAVYPNKVNASGTPDVIDAFYTEIGGPGPDRRFQVLPNAVISADAAALFWAPNILDKWEIVPPDLIQRW